MKTQEIEMTGRKLLRLKALWPAEYLDRLRQCELQLLALEEPRQRQPSNRRQRRRQAALQRAARSVA
jgi:hypothetical protein